MRPLHPMDIHKYAPYVMGTAQSNYMSDRLNDLIELRVGSLQKAREDQLALAKRNATLSDELKAARDAREAYYQETLALKEMVRQREEARDEYYRRMCNASKQIQAQNDKIAMLEVSRDGFLAANITANGTINRLEKEATNNATLLVELRKNLFEEIEDARAFSKKAHETEVLLRAQLENAGQLLRAAREPWPKPHGERTFVVHLKVSPQGNVILGPPEQFDEMSFFADELDRGPV